jgi:hypothetical protein
MDMRLGALELFSEARQEARAVDQNLDLVARARRGLPVCPEARRRLKGLPPADAGKPPPVMCPNQRLDPVADGCVGTSEQIRVHTDFVTESRRFLIRG